MVFLRCICLLQKTKVGGSAVNKTFFLDSFFGNGASVVVEKEFISMKAFMMMQYSIQVSQVQQWQLCLDSLWWTLGFMSQKTQQLLYPSLYIWKHSLWSFSCLCLGLWICHPYPKCYFNIHNRIEDLAYTQLNWDWREGWPYKTQCA